MDLFIGETDDGEEAYISADKAHSTFICGKRGQGKSYTMGDIIEEVHTETDDTIPLVIDPMGIYWTMAQENQDQRDTVWDWGLSPEAFPITLLVPGNPEKRISEPVLNELKNRGLKIRSMKLNPSDISPDGWCNLFDLNINKPMGITLYRAVRELGENRDSFNLDDIIDKIEKDSGSNESTKEALLNRLYMAEDWNIFTEEYTDIWDRLSRDEINVLDLSFVEPGKYGLRNLVLNVLAKDMFRRRMEARRKEGLSIETDIPKVWLFIDEAHNFAPSSGSTLANDILVRWVKEGRQPGLSMSVATQQPSAVDSEILSQCDIIITHKITTRQDVKSLNKLSQDYMGGELKTYMRNIGEIGQAVYVNDDEESVKMVKMRPRKSSHGGGEA